jgi:hypothetical protein
MVSSTFETKKRIRHEIKIVKFAVILSAIDPSLQAESSWLLTCPEQILFDFPKSVE